MSEKQNKNHLEQDATSQPRSDMRDHDHAELQNFERSYIQYENFLKKAFEKGVSPLPSQFASVESVKDYRAKEERYDYEAYVYDYRSVCYSNVLDGDVDISKYATSDNDIVIVSKDNIEEFECYNITHLN